MSITYLKYYKYLLISIIIKMAYMLSIDSDYDSSWESVESVESINLEPSWFYDDDAYILDELIKESKKYIDLTKNEINFLKEILYLEYKEKYAIKDYKHLSYCNKINKVNCFLCYSLNDGNIYSNKSCEICNLYHLNFRR